MGLTVAIVGSGPGGFYSAAALIKDIPDCKVDVIDRLPTPFGLIRAGVAPDHQSSKKIAKIFERTALSPQVRFLGNVEVPRDVSIAELRGLYDAVVLATGAPRDRRMGIPGEDLGGVYGSSEFVGWYNAHPDFRDLSPDLETGTAVVIGAGNVALDVARLLAKTGEEVRATDMAHYAADAIDVSPVKNIYVFARRGPLQAAFTHKEVKEFGELDNAVTLVDPAVLPSEDVQLEDKGRGSQEKNVGYLREYAKHKGDEKPVRIHLEFYAMPVDILGEDGKVSAIRMERTRLDDSGRVTPTGETFEVPCNIVVACIGTQSTPLDNVAYDDKNQRFQNRDGEIEPGLYVAGWAKRGPSGTIATNFPDGERVAQYCKALTPDASRQGPAGLDQLLSDRKVRVVTYQDWKRIEAAEEAGASHGAPRRKFTTIPEMIGALG